MTRIRPTVGELAAGIRSGDRATLSRAITLAESRRADDQEVAQDLLVEVMSDTGRARRIGLTGVPGAGKSTMIEALGLRLVEQGHRVAVLVIDPSSSRTGGSILADKTRMPRLSVRDEAYIRPSPSSGVLGGVGRRTREALFLCEAAGFDVVIVESVGVGQSEFLMAEIVDFFCLMLVPGAGDDIQGIKRGIVECADLVVVNKADGEALRSARRAASDYRHAVRLLPDSTPGWATPVVLASALEGTGVAEVWETVERHRAHLEESGILDARRQEQMSAWLTSLWHEAIIQSVMTAPGVADGLGEARADVLAGRATVPQAVHGLLRVAGLAND